MNTAIKITNLSKSFKEFKAVSDINFEVAPNKVVGFLGPNGAGKTTTIRMIVGLSKPTSGQIDVDGENIVFGNAKSNKLFGYLPELPSFYGWMTGLEYLNFIADSFGIDKAVKEKKIKELLSLVNLTNFAKKRTSTYSNGMKQRLGIAQALINDPKVLIMDEPVSSLDPIGRREILAIIERLKKNMTIFLSTHILSDVDRICDDVIIINKGKIVITQPLSELKEKYAKPILEVEFTKDPENIEDDLKRESWVEKFEKNGSSIKIWPKDRKIIEENVPLRFFAKKDFGVIHYGLNLPQVEDLFIDLIEEKK